MTELNYKASNIAKAERLHDANFFQTVETFGDESPRLTDILFVLEAGGLSEEEAGDLVDSKGIVETIKLVVDRLTDAGFLANSIPKETKEKALKAAKQATEAVSQTTGETTKA